MESPDNQENRAPNARKRKFILTCFLTIGVPVAIYLVVAFQAYEHVWYAIFLVADAMAGAYITAILMWKFVLADIQPRK
jgi:hypothetical protein